MRSHVGLQTTIFCKNNRYNWTNFLSSFLFFSSSVSSLVFSVRRFCFLLLCFSNTLKNASKQKGATKVQKLRERIERKAISKNFHLETNPPSIKARNKKVVAKTFHKMGIVVPLDENDVGYRDLQISNGKKYTL